MPPVGEIIPIELKKVEHPDEVTPESLKKDLADMGLICDETQTKKLSERIAAVRKDLKSTDLHTFLIARPTPSFAWLSDENGTSVETELAATTSAGAQGLVPYVAATDPAVQRLYALLGSDDPDTRRYVEHLVQDDPVAGELHEKVNDPDQSARSFVERLAAADGTRPLTAAVAQFDSFALTHFATLAQLSLTPAALGSWTVGTEQICNSVSAMLKVIQEKDYYASLKAEYGRKHKTWPGREGSQHKDEPDIKTGDAIHDFYKQALSETAKMTFKDLNRRDAEGFISKAIGPPDDLAKNDYQKKDSMLLFLAENYNDSTREADGVGVITLEWEIEIKDYKRKSKHGGDSHRVILDIKSRSISYSGAAGFSDMCEDNKYLTKECNSICAKLKKWYGENPGKGTWPTSNKTCPEAS
ncbi:hypothetical protein CLV63_102117 [Murinocardiopsis flavida]|uniref:Uncharacterized protein n=1 Tax=Murinocardiopsis flavida TaxID=645275 RepID=A0A2P8DS04_9ACTN|nr:lectin [Murinocardiopsis flavida]PSK99990.1 hypothetical protein CLV63_102117 [Murinocardiopsis flavida]